MYYTVKLKWKEPVPGKDELKKITKTFLVYAESCTEAEMRMSKWVPANYQDPIVEEVKQTAIGEIKVFGMSETFWQVKFMDDADGTSAKPKPFFAVLNGNNLNEIVVKIKSDYAFMDAEEVKKFKGIVDDDLISEEIRKLRPIEDNEKQEE